MFCATFAFVTAGAGRLDRQVTSCDAQQREQQRVNVAQQTGSMMSFFSFCFRIRLKTSRCVWIAELNLLRRDTLP